ncbi:hypothetical protein CES85_3494 (plasmid) [Ochrobactrum quorumnocens]|uniref:Uncharacterized protein n=1 Tax=Ochrobactrum quorumnocens TaxID=271865 RepID=A0A248UPL9_9HYPH|nr:hypothetical protein CES85_3494 [[Ochrobactrum] quorumnocens]
MPVEAPVIKTAGIWLIGLLFSIIDPIFMTIIMIESKYDERHVNVNIRCGEF